MAEKYLGSRTRKKDWEALTTGQPVYTDDLAPAGCLTVKLLRSPHAHARIRSIRTDLALKVPGVVAVYTYEDVPQERFTLAGQTYPEPSAYDRLILDRELRYVGDPAAIVAAETEEAADKALRLIKVDYEVLPAVLDFHTAMDNPTLVHPEESWHCLCPVGADNRRNLAASGSCGEGDVEKAFAGSRWVVEETYHTKACQQAMMETFRTWCQMDTYGRLTVVSSTQIVFHVRRILSNALGIPKSRIRVVKPRIGGGFGAKQTSVSEIYPAFVTLKTGRPSKIVFSRYESQIASSPRHEMELRVKIGAAGDGHLTAIEVYTLSNTGAYAEHGPTTVGLSGHKSIPLYRADAFRFSYDVVYTNRMSAGAYRGYGATQGIFAVESAIDELAHRMGMDPAELRMRNMVREGDRMPAYYGEISQSCAMDRCLEAVREAIGWDEKYPRRVLENGHIRGVGMALDMQGSGISGVDVGSVTLRVSDDGGYTMLLGCADMGTGCDTILAQMAADMLNCPIESIAVLSGDTDASPYDSGSYASSTTYITGMACVKCCKELTERIIAYGAEMLGCRPEEAEFDGEAVLLTENPGEKVSLREISYKAQSGSGKALEATASHSSPTSPPPYMVGAAEVDIDPETGKLTVVRYEAAVDCGTVVNENLARVQAEGGILQGIGMAVMEDIVYDEKGRDMSNSFMQYRLPTKEDTGRIHVQFCPSYEPTGPFGAKSIGEVVINTPAPAIANAVYNATGLRFRELPITAEKILLALREKDGR